MSGPVFEVRRSRPHVLMQMAMAAALFLVALGNLANLFRTGQAAGGPLIASGFFALIMGFPTLRLKGPYFALAMLSAAVIMQRLMLIFWEYTGGEEGINGVEPDVDLRIVERARLAQLEVDGPAILHRLTDLRIGRDDQPHRFLQRHG